MDDLKEALNKKILGLPGWVWLLIAVGLFFLFTRSRKSNSEASTSYQMTSTPTTDQMTANAVSDLKTSMQSQIDDRFGEITEQNADALAGTQQQLTDFMGAQAVWFQQLMDKESQNQDAMIGAINTNSDKYMSALQTSNQNFLDAMYSMMQTWKPNGVSPVNGSTIDPLAGLPQWAKDRLQSPYWQTKKYLRQSETNLGPEYQHALNDLLRSDTASGLSTSTASSEAFNELNRLIASGQVIQNPLYHS
jgi:hypothetical protein